MANVYKETTRAGKIRWKVAYRDRNGTRRFLRIGRLNKKDAEAFAWRVDQLASAAAGNTSPPADLIRWADGLPQNLRQKLIEARLVKLESEDTNSRWMCSAFRERMIEAGVITPTEPINDQWLAPEFRKRLADAGLIRPIAGETLGEWLDRYLKGHKSVKAATILAIRNAERNLLEYFGADRSLASITPHDAREWRSWLASEGNRRDVGDKRKQTKEKKGLADNTVRRRTGIARQMFAAAIDAGLLERNPFAKLVVTTHGNEKRQFFVPAEWAEQCIEQAPDQDWKTIIALARFGGLRSPSELLGLRWVDVDLPGGKMTIHAPKTAHHASGGVRQCPIFPELRLHLEASWALAEDKAENLSGNPLTLPLSPAARGEREPKDPLRGQLTGIQTGSEFVITRYRKSQNMRSTLQKIIARAGLTPWPKLFQNLRASRETELLAAYPAKDVASWLGNSVPVAMKHYAMPRAETFERATREGTLLREASPAAGAEQRGGTESGTISGY